MDSVAQIEDVIVRGAEGFFDDADDREDLHVTIRIAHDFYKFLRNCGERRLLRHGSFLGEGHREGHINLHCGVYCAHLRQYTNLFPAGSNSGDCGFVLSDESSTGKPR
jgi:hypothetical protein